MTAKIHKIDLEAIFYRISKIPIVKFQIFGYEFTSLENIISLGVIDFTETNF